MAEQPWNLNQICRGQSSFNHDCSLVQLGFSCLFSHRSWYSAQSSIPLCSTTTWRLGWGWPACSTPRTRPWGKLRRWIASSDTQGPAWFICWHWLRYVGGPKNRRNLLHRCCVIMHCCPVINRNSLSLGIVTWVNVVCVYLVWHSGTYSQIDQIHQAY